MPLSPREEEVLALLEAELSADDPARDATPTRHAPPLGVRHVVALVLALLGLVAVATVVADRPAVLAGATVAVIVPWLVGVALARSPRRPRQARRRIPILGIGYGTTALAAALVAVVLVVTPTPGRTLVALVVTIVVALWTAVRVLTRTDRTQPR